MLWHVRVPIRSLTSRQLHALLQKPKLAQKPIAQSQIAADGALVTVHAGNVNLGALAIWAAERTQSFRVFAVEAKVPPTAYRMHPGADDPCLVKVAHLVKVLTLAITCDPRAQTLF